MKCDGHIKLTRKAIEVAQSQCHFDAGICFHPLFSKRDRFWSNKAESNRADNILGFVQWLFGYTLNKNTLPDMVAGVDIHPDYLQYHFSAEGQKYHFMKAENESEMQAYLNACNFIKTHTENWIQMSLMDLKKAINDKSRTISNTIRQSPGRELALALHCLQDSFSPAHAWRSHSANKKDLGGSHLVAPIRRIYTYENQNKHHHGHYDYLSGTPDSVYGKLAVEASAKLILIGMKAIADKRPTLENWMQFKSTWLPQRELSSTANATRPMPTGYEELRRENKSASSFKLHTLSNDAG